MQKKTTKLMALLLSLVMVLSIVPVTAMAVEADEFTVVVSMEGLTLGQGLYVEPTAYTLDEINDLIAAENYGPYTEDDLPASMATLAMMLDKGLEYENTGSWDSGMYLSAVKGIDKGTVNIPSVITENGGPNNDTHDGNDDEYLGEFDYNWMSGWMITVNDYMIDVGCSDWVFTKGVSSGKCQDYGNIYVVRWQFTLNDYGADLGHNTGWGNEAYFDHVNKDMMYAAYALSDNAAAKASVMTTMENLTATAAEVAAAEAALDSKVEEYKYVFTTNNTEKMAGLSLATGGNYVSESGTVFNTTGAFQQIDILRGGTEESLEALVINGTEFKVEDLPSSLTPKTFTGLGSGQFKIRKYASTNETTWGRLFFKKDTTVTQDVNIQFVFKTETATEPEPTPVPSQDVNTVLADTMAQLAATVTEPAFGTFAGEWTVLCLARGGYYAKDNAYFSSYYDRIVETVNETATSVTLANGALENNKSTDNSRLILALSAIGKDATSVGDWNLITPFEDFSWIKRQGINGPIFALIALDTNNYQTTDTTIRQQCVDYILGKQLTDGGWALSGTTSDPDITAMALQALVNYKDQTAVATAAEEAFAWLSSAQNEDGGYASWGTVNSESAAQVITACTAWGINPDTDPDFVKGENSVIDYILTFYDATAKGFKHTLDGSVDAMATDQACYALIAYDRFLDGKTALYDMSDVTFETGTLDEVEGIAASLGLPKKVEAGKSFNATVSLNQWDNEAGYKLIDLIMTVPDPATVTGVTASNRLSGGEVGWNVDADGKLRVAYFDANENKSLTINGTTFPAELFTVTITIDGPVEYDEEISLELAITGMSLKKSSDSFKTADTTKVDTSNAKGKVEVTSEITVTPGELYVGDGVDLIAENKHAVALIVTGVDEGFKVIYTAGVNNMEFKYSAEMTEKVGGGNTIYVALVDTTFTLEKLATKENYTIKEGTPATITFADSNGDGVVNAQDALASVDAWLRKTDPKDDQLLALNVNGDSRLNTYDALGIVEHFVNGTDHNVVTKAATKDPTETAEKTA